MDEESEGVPEEPDGEEEVEPEVPGAGSIGVVPPPISSGNDSTGDEDAVSSTRLPAVELVRREEVPELRRLEFSRELVSSFWEAVSSEDVVPSALEEASCNNA